MSASNSGLLMQVVLRQGEEDGPREEAHRTSKYRQSAQRTFNKLKPSHEEVITIVYGEPLTGPKQVRRVKGKGGAQLQRYQERQNAKGKALLRDWKQGGHG